MTLVLNVVASLELFEVSQREMVCSLLSKKKMPRDEISVGKESVFGHH